jgi:hypothetical protein
MLKMFLQAIFFKTPRDFIKIYIRSINLRRFMEMANTFDSIMTWEHSKCRGKFALHRTLRM